MEVKQRILEGLSRSHLVAIVDQHGLEVLRLFQELRHQAEEPQKAAEQAGLDEDAFAIYGLLDSARLSIPRDAGGSKYGEPNRDLASLIGEAIAPYTTLVDWFQKDDVQREMRSKIKKQLRASGMAGADVDSVAQTIVDLTKVRRKR